MKIWEGKETPNLVFGPGIESKILTTTPRIRILLFLGEYVPNKFEELQFFFFLDRGEAEFAWSLLLLL